VSVYFDASILVSLFTIDPFTARAEHFVETSSPAPIVSDFAAAEFASAVARRVRNRELPADEAQIAFTQFDVWAARIDRVQMGPSDVAAAEATLRSLDLNLRTPDALHLCLTQRLRLTLATFDSKMVAAAASLGIPLAAA
jgi:predicted nucleic acid-binding protein